MGSRATLEYLVPFLVDHPEDIRVEEEESDGTTIYDLFVHPDDVGKVIGRNGRIARALRTVVKAAAVSEDKHVAVEIAD